MRTCTKTSVLKLFSFQVSWNTSWCEEIKRGGSVWKSGVQSSLTSDVLLKPAVLLRISVL